MKISPKAMARALSDKKIMLALEKNDMNFLANNGFEVVSGIITVKNEVSDKTGLLDHRKMKWDVDETRKRYFDSVKEINVHGNDFARQLLSQHEKLIECRTDFNDKQISGFRKVLICLWHNIKIVKGIVIDDSEHIRSE